jgi:predicted nucleic acid-binding Zn ribbon protein
MPIYTYEVVTDDPTERDTFEVLQDVSEPPLETEPETGRPVRRIISAPAVVGSTRSQRDRNVLSDSNIAAKGFTRYERVDHGTYARTAGTKGPKTFRKP